MKHAQRPASRRSRKIWKWNDAESIFEHAPFTLHDCRQDAGQRANRGFGFNFSEIRERVQYTSVTLTWPPATGYLPCSHFRAQPEHFSYPEEAIRTFLAKQPRLARA
ncbi:MAG: hypothetical protein WBQ69_10035 [Gallionella sp.]